MRLMSKLGQFWRPLIIVGAVLVADLGGRFAFDFQMSRVVPLEAVLFGAATLAAIWAATRDQVVSRTARRIDLWLAIVFVLGALRAGLWFAGLQVGVANLIVLAVSVLAAIGYGLRRWIVRSPEP
jgi:hypothetical protein